MFFREGVMAKMKLVFSFLSVWFSIFITYYVITSFFLESITFQPIFFSSMWSFSYFSTSIYLLFSYSSLFYLISNSALFFPSENSSSHSNFYTIEGQDLLRLLITPLMLVFLIHVTWVGPVIISWFGHLGFSYFQFKITYVLFFLFTTYMIAFSFSIHFSSLYVYDFSLIILNFCFWTWLTFFSNNLFTFIFFIEILSTLIMLMLTTSTFSATYFYNTNDLTHHNYFHYSTPVTFMQTLLFFFWITLLSSLLLFVFMILFYLKIFSFDWNCVDFIFLYVLTISSFHYLLSISFIWILFLVCIFLKCGTVPLYFWKPTFFKGISMLPLFFYIYIYYFSLYIFFTYVLFFYLNEVFMFNVYLLIVLLIFSTFCVNFLLFESFYVKSFLALSSILNSILIFFCMCSYYSIDLIFLI